MESFSYIDRSSANANSNPPVQAKRAAWSFHSHKIYQGVDKRDGNCANDENTERIEVHLSADVERRENLTLRAWLQETYEIADVGSLFSNSELRTFGMIPVTRTFDEGFDSIRLILEEADRGESNLEFAGIKIAPRFVALLFPVICCVLYIFLFLQLSYVTSSLSNSNADEQRMLKTFPSPIVRTDWPSRITILALFLLLPFAIQAYFIFIGASELVASYFGSSAVYATLLTASIGACFAFFYSYYGSQSAISSAMSDGS